MLGSQGLLVLLATVATIHDGKLQINYEDFIYPCSKCITEGKWNISNGMVRSQMDGRIWYLSSLGLVSCPFSFHTTVFDILDSYS